jgi:hypothetical protein
MGECAQRIVGDGNAKLACACGLARIQACSVTPCVCEMARISACPMRPAAPVTTSFISASAARSC